MAIEIHDARAIGKLRVATAAASETLALVGARIRAGISTADIDAWVREDTKARNGTPSQLGYHGFSAAVHGDTSATFIVGGEHAASREANHVVDVARRCHHGRRVSVRAQFRMRGTSSTCRVGRLQSQPG